MSFFRCRTSSALHVSLQNSDNLENAGGSEEEQTSRAGQLETRLDSVIRHRWAARAGVGEPTSRYVARPWRHHTHLKRFGDEPACTMREFTARKTRRDRLAKGDFDPKHRHSRQREIIGRDHGYHALIRPEAVWASKRSSARSKTCRRMRKPPAQSAKNLESATGRVKKTLETLFCFWCPGRESNPDLRFRRPP